MYYSTIKERKCITAIFDFDGVLGDFMIKIAVCGYGNLGKAVEKKAIDRGFDIKGIISNRDGLVSPYKTPFYHFSQREKLKGKVDVVINCGSSHKDIPQNRELLLRDFNTVDSFDTHAKIHEHLSLCKKRGEESNTLAIISAGWDPGLLSIFRLYSKAIMQKGIINTFWGKGVSRGHTAVIKGIRGVEDAIQYTVPKKTAIALAKEGVMLKDEQRHNRICYVVAKEDHKRIEEEIKNTPFYFKGYDTRVNFISREEFEQNHANSYHGGEVICCNGDILDFSLKIQDNSLFTADILLSYANACKKLYEQGNRGALTPFDIPPSFLVENIEDIYTLL